MPRAPSICGISVEGAVANGVPIVRIAVGFDAAALTQHLDTAGARLLAQRLLAVADATERAARRGPA